MLTGMAPPAGQTLRSGAPVMGKGRVVVTGGVGLLGSHLRRRFLADGWDVVSRPVLPPGPESAQSDRGPSPAIV